MCVGMCISNLLNAMIVDFSQASGFFGHIHAGNLDGI